MPIDDEVKAAIEEAARQLGQPTAAARRLTSWLTDMSERELSAAEENQHLSTLRNAIAVDGSGDAE